MVREPEWDDEQREIALAFLRYERECCHKCGGHYSNTRDETMMRDVKDVEDICLDCQAIEATRKDRHKDHTEHYCDCADRAVYVDRYVPLDAAAKAARERMGRRSV